MEKGAVCPTMKASIVRKMAKATVNMDEDGGYEAERVVEGKGSGGGRVEKESGRGSKDIESGELISEKTSDQMRRMRQIDESTNAWRIDDSANVWRILLHQLSNSKNRSQGAPLSSSTFVCCLRTAILDKSSMSEKLIHLSID